MEREKQEGSEAFYFAHPLSEHFREKIADLEAQVKTLKSEKLLYEFREGAFECPNCSCEVCVRNRSHFISHTLK
jgi:hypothetical protein